MTLGESGVPAVRAAARWRITAPSAIHTAALRAKTMATCEDDTPVAYSGAWPCRGAPHSTVKR